MLKVHAPPDIYKSISSYAQAVEGSSSQRLPLETIGLTSVRTLARDFDVLARRVWSNIDAMLTVWLANARDLPRSSEIRQDYLDDHKMAVSVVQVAQPHSGWLIELDLIAVE